MSAPFSDVDSAPEVTFPAARRKDNGAERPEAKRRRVASPHAPATPFSPLSPASPLSPDTTTLCSTPTPLPPPDHSMLHRAISQGDLPLLDSLLQRLASSSLSLLHSRVNGCDPTDGQTLLTHACLLGDVRLVKSLVRSGADVRRANRDGWTPAHIASFKGSLDIMMYLLRCGRPRPNYGHLGQLEPERRESPPPTPPPPTRRELSTASRHSTASTPPSSPFPADANSPTPASTPQPPRQFRDAATTSRKRTYSSSSSSSANVSSFDSPLSPFSPLSPSPSPYSSLPPPSPSLSLPPCSPFSPRPSSPASHDSSSSSSSPAASTPTENRWRRRTNLDEDAEPSQRRRRTSISEEDDSVDWPVRTSSTTRLSAVANSRDYTNTDSLADT